MIGDSQHLYNIHRESILQAGVEYFITVDVIRIMTNEDDNYKYYTDFTCVQVNKNEKGWFFRKSQVVFDQKVVSKNPTDAREPLLKAAKEFIEKQTI